MKRSDKRHAQKFPWKWSFKNHAKEIGWRILFAIPSFLLVLKNYEKQIGQVLSLLVGFLNQTLMLFMDFLGTLDSSAILKIGNVY
jgi:hypothetical protein